MRVRRLLAGDADPAEYLAGANLAFGHWGDKATFAWAFRGGEILFLDDESGHPAAASGINYRTLLDGRQVAIISGAWTSPAARGTGAFTRLIEATHVAARERDAITIAFGRMDNVSRRRVEEAGAQVQATLYCRSLAPDAQSAPLESLDRLDPGAFDIPTAFRYTPAEWRTQFLDRPHAIIECLGRRGEWAAIVEQATDFDRVLAVSHEQALPALAARAHAAGRRLFWFTLKRPSLACEWTDGFLSTFPPTDVSAWEIQNGDRM
jgi:broad specificity phosphatase PhoE